MIAPLIIISAGASRNNNHDLSRAPAKRFKNRRVARRSSIREPVTPATLTPQRQQLLGDQIRHLLGEEQVCPLHSANATGMPKGPIEPVRPRHIEECSVAHAPDDPYGRAEPLQSRLDRRQRVGLERHRVTIELTLAQRGTHEG
jgi:hypothetical protein